jgi:hypothetical protein
MSCPRAASPHSAVPSAKIVRHSTPGTRGGVAVRCVSKGSILPSARGSMLPKLQPSRLIPNFNRFDKRSSREYAVSLRAGAASQDFRPDGIGDPGSEHQFPGRGNLRKGNHLLPHFFRGSLDVDGRANHVNGWHRSGSVFHPLHPWNKDEQNGKKRRGSFLEPASALHEVPEASSDRGKWQRNGHCHDQAERALNCQRQQCQAQKRRGNACNPHATAEASWLS